jgi:hypothetical protein
MFHEVIPMVQKQQNKTVRTHIKVLTGPQRILVAEQQEELEGKRSLPPQSLHLVQ